MASKTGKLELTWVGKEQRPRLEPRLLLEDPGKSYGDPKSPNMLIRGDNLLALKALEQDFAGQVKCGYIDPPFNTQQAFEHYEDGIEHSLWLSLMRDRLEVLHRLLRPDGSLFIHIDDNELGYLIALTDEVFQRQNRVSVITFKQGSATGHKTINPGCITNTNFLLWYCKSRDAWNPKRVFTNRERNERYNQFVRNRNSHHTRWEIVPLTKAFAQSIEVEPRQLKKMFPDLDKRITEFVLANADSVVQLARPNYDGVSKDARQMIDQSKKDPASIYHLRRDGYSDMYIKRGERIIFFRDTLKEIDGKLVPGEPLTTLWDDIPSHNLHNEGDVEFPKGKKPEALIKRCFELASSPGDWVLDSFGGSGTTAAVAHKMERRWITVEMGEHCETHIVPRLRRVIDGQDSGGITSTVDWKGGGGFKYYELAESLLVRDKALDVFYVNPKYNADMLIRAICKVENFRYRPRGRWHGYSSESHFIHVVTQILNQPYLDMLAADLGEQDALLVYCTKRDAGLNLPPNVKIKRIPKDLLTKCEFRSDLK